MSFRIVLADGWSQTAVGERVDKLQS